MGLDMGLSKRKKVVVSDELAYWRKAYQIREWFAENLECFKDNGRTIVEKGDLENLLDACESVLKNHDLAPDLLPADDGYDELYFEDLEDTVDQISKILETFDWENDELFYWEWY